MDFKSLLSQLDQLNEATEKTKTGIKHTAEPGGYGRKDDEDEEGNKVKAKDTEKKGRGRPKKATSASGEDKKYDFSAFGVKAGKDVKLPKWDKKKTKKHSIKEYLDQVEKALNENEITPDMVSKFNEPNKKFYTKNPHFGRGTEIKSVGKTIDDKGKPVSALATKVTPKFNKPDPVTRLSRGSFNAPVEEAEQIQIKPASQMPKTPGQTAGATSQPGQAPVAGQPKKDTQVIAQGNKVLGSVDNPQLAQQIKQSIGKGEMTLMPDQTMHEDGEKWIQGAIKHPGAFTKKAKSHGMSTSAFANKVLGNKEDYPAKTEKQAQLAKTLKKMHEADQPPRDALASPLTLEAKKPDANKNGIPDYAEDGKGKNDLKKKKVKEGMDQRLNAARAEGKAHGLRGHAHCGKNYDDMEEARCYHEGYKEGLDECYGQMPIQGYVGETGNEVADMASYGAHTPSIADEGNAFTEKLKVTPQGGKFRLGNKTFTDTSSLEESPFAFESWDKQLNALLESKVDEGMSVSISKGQQGSPDSVSVTAQDGEADQLLSVIKSAGLGLFGGDDAGATTAGPMTVDTDGEPAEVGTGGDAIEVVGDHDGMMSLMKKLSGIGGGEAPAQDDAEEESCNECGMAYESCGCDHEGQEQVDEVESEDQMTYQMAEDNPPDSGAAEVDAEDQSVANANAAAAAYNPSDDIDEGAGGPEASEEPVVPETHAGDTAEDGNEVDEDEDQKQKDGLDESSFFNLYKKLAMLSEESTAEKDDKAEKAAKKVAKDIEYDEGHKGKDDDKAEEAGKKVKKDIEYDDKKDEKEKVDESYANSVDDTFETDIDFMMNIITGGLNKRKSTGQTTIPVVATQEERLKSHTTTDINESADSVSAWKKLAGLK